MKMTIPLRNRYPVSIEADDWPLIASASKNDIFGMDGKTETRWRIQVRQHKDGRAIIYASDAFGISIGYYVNTKSDGSAIVAYINQIATGMNEAKEGSRELWTILAAKCIASLPPEELK